MLIFYKKLESILNSLIFVAGGILKFLYNLVIVCFMDWSSIQNCLLYWFLGFVADFNPLLGCFLMK